MKHFSSTVIPAYAKINLSLDILGTLDNGMHRVETVMHTISLTDTISLKVSASGENKIVIECKNKTIPLDEKNLVYKAAKLLLDDYPQKMCNIHFHIQKKIPVCAGLGGGSSDAAATIKGLNQAMSLNLSRSKLNDYAKQIGSDVPFLLHKGSCLATGTGTDLTMIKALSGVKAILINPGIFISTKNVYQMYDQCIIPDNSHPDTKSIVSAIETNNYQKLTEEMKNVLEIPVFKMHPEIATIKKQLIDFGCDAALMSGSGSTVYGISRDADLLESISKKFDPNQYKIYIVDLI